MAVNSAFGYVSFHATGARTSFFDDHFISYPYNFPPRYKPKLSSSAWFFYTKIPGVCRLFPFVDAREERFFTLMLFFKHSTLVSLLCRSRYRRKDPNLE
jgi:hypothetical protein